MKRTNIKKVSIPGFSFLFPHCALLMILSSVTSACITMQQANDKMDAGFLGESRFIHLEYADGAAFKPVIQETDPIFNDAVISSILCLKHALHVSQGPLKVLIESSLYREKEIDLIVPDNPGRFSCGMPIPVPDLGLWEYMHAGMEDFDHDMSHAWQLDAADMLEVPWHDHYEYENDAVPATPSHFLGIVGFGISLLIIRELRLYKLPAG